MKFANIVVTFTCKKPYNISLLKSRIPVQTSCNNTASLSQELIDRFFSQHEEINKFITSYEEIPTINSSNLPNMSRPFMMVTHLRLFRTIFSTTTSGFSCSPQQLRFKYTYHKIWGLWKSSSRVQVPDYLGLSTWNVTFFFTLPPGNLFTSSSFFPSEVLPVQQTIKPISAEWFTICWQNR